MTDRFAAEGFVAIAPDLFHGKTTTSPDEAGRLLMELDVSKASQDMEAPAPIFFAGRNALSREFGVVGFCMGGALAQYTATHDNSVGAAVSFYGGFKKVDVDWDALNVPIILIYGEKDHGVPAAQGQDLGRKLTRWERCGSDRLSGSRSCVLQRHAPELQKGCCSKTHGNGPLRFFANGSSFAELSD